VRAWPCRRTPPAWGPASTPPMSRRGTLGPAIRRSPSSTPFRWGIRRRSGRSWLSEQAWRGHLLWFPLSRELPPQAALGFVEVDGIEDHALDVFYVRSPTNNHDTYALVGHVLSELKMKGVILERFH